jgi:hypothetical protein
VTPLWSKQVQHQLAFISVQALLHASTAATAYSAQHYLKLAKPLLQCPSLQQAFHTMALALDNNTYVADPDLVEAIYNQM